MVWCDSCKADVEVDTHETGGFTCCYTCGRVLEDIAFASDVQFAKGADGEGEMVGQFVGETGQVRSLTRMAGGRMWGVRGDSHEVAVNKGRQELSAMIDHFVIRPREDSLEAAHRLYKLAVQRGFTKGRRVAHVAAACLYIICRQETKPFMLIDYSDLLQVNVYVLGSVYLQLLKLLRLEEHPSFTRPIDPSLYIHRFTERLFERNVATPIANTALRLISSMKRDWMQTGRRPSGVCGAALFIAAHIHGLETTKRDIIGVVHVGCTTLDKRVREFATTTAAALTVSEFDDQAEELEQETQRLLEAKSKEATLALPAPTAPNADKDAKPHTRETACEHVALGERHFAHGMCRRCFEAFLATSGGIWSEGAADPPAFAKAAKAKLLALTGPTDDETEGIDPQELAEQRELLQLEAEMAEAMVRLRAGGDDEGSADGVQDELASGGEFGRSVLEHGRGMIVARAADAKAADAKAASAVSAEAASKGGGGRKRARTKASAKAAAAAKGANGGGGDAAAASAGDGPAAGASAGKGPSGSGASGSGRQAAAMPAVDQPASPSHAAQQPDTQQQQQQQSGTQQPPTQRPGTPDPEEALNPNPLPSPASPSKGRMRPNISNKARPAKRLRTEEQATQDGEPSGEPPGSNQQQMQQQQQEQQQEQRQQQEQDGQQVQQQLEGQQGQEEPDGHATGMEIEVAGQVDGEQGQQEQQEMEGLEVGEAEEEEESEGGLSDLDEDEIDEYIHTKNEAQIKEAYWSHMHKDWLEKQQAKQAALAAVAEEAAAAAAANGTATTNADDSHADEDEEGGDGDAAAGTAGAAGARAGPKRPGPKKGSKHKKVAPMPEARSAAHAAQMMLDKKHLSDKVNYEALTDLFAPPTTTAAGDEGGAAEAGPGYGTPGGLFGSGGRPPTTHQRTSNSRLGMGGLIGGSKRATGAGAFRPGGLGSGAGGLGGGFGDALAINRAGARPPLARGGRPGGL